MYTGVQWEWTIRVWEDTLPQRRLPFVDSPTPGGPLKIRDRGRLSAASHDGPGPTHAASNRPGEMIGEPAPAPKTPTKGLTVRWCDALSASDSTLRWLRIEGAAHPLTGSLTGYRHEARAAAPPGGRRPHPAGGSARSDHPASRRWPTEARAPLGADTETRTYGVADKLVPAALMESAGSCAWLSASGGAGRLARPSACCRFLSGR